MCIFIKFLSTFFRCSNSVFFSIFLIRQFPRLFISPPSFIICIFAQKWQIHFFYKIFSWYNLYNSEKRIQYLDGALWDEHLIHRRHTNWRLLVHAAIDIKWKYTRVGWAPLGWQYLPCIYCYIYIYTSREFACALTLQFRNDFGINVCALNAYIRTMCHSDVNCTYTSSI